MCILLFAGQDGPIKGEKNHPDTAFSCKNHESISRVDLNFSTSDEPPSGES